MARCTWALSDQSLTEHMIACTEPGAKNWLFFMHDTISHSDFTRMIVTLWAIWSARRKAIHESIFQSPEHIHRFVESYLADWLSIQTVGKVAHVQHQRRDTRERWLPPQTGYSKMNVDGAFSCDGRRGVAVAFCRDERGTYVGTSALVMDHITDAATLEALACREGISLAEDLHLSRVHIVSDCQEVINDIGKNSSGPYAAILMEINTRKSVLPSCHFMYESRNFNFEAHRLAKHASSLGIGRYVWLGTPYDQVMVPVNIEFEV